jgi:hypothetical protein
MPTEEDFTEWAKMIREMLAAKDLKYHKRFTDWEVARLEEWKDMTTFSRKQGNCIERIYQDKM